MAIVQYEIQKYGTLKVFESQKGHREVKRLLAESPENDKPANRFLTGMGKSLLK